MTTDAHRAIFEAVLQRAAAGEDLSALITPYISPAVVFHSSDGLVGGWVELAQSTWEARLAMPDLSLLIEGALFEHDRVVVQTVMEATHTGVYRGIPPSNARVRIPICFVFRGEGGRIDEMWEYGGIYDSLMIAGGYIQRG